MVVSGVAHYGLLVSFGNCACLHQTRSTNETWSIVGRSVAVVRRLRRWEFWNASRRLCVCGDTLSVLRSGQQCILLLDNELQMQLGPARFEYQLRD